MKPQSQVLSEYLAATTPTHWMFDEVGEYLFGEKPEEEREALLDEVFDRLEEERGRLNSMSLGPEDITEFTLRVEKPGGRCLVTSYPVLPSPVLLLELCLKMSAMGDEVVVEHSYVSGDRCEFKSEWPFGMDWAVRATTPMGETLADEAGFADDDWSDFFDRVRGASRVVGVSVLVGFLLGILTGRFNRR